MEQLAAECGLVVVDAQDVDPGQYVRAGNLRGPVYEAVYERSEEFDPE
jgi:hypothetical protein